MKIKCKVITRSSRNEVVGLEGLNKLDLNFRKSNGEDDFPCLRVYLTAVPVDGKANKELIKLLAKELKIGKSRIAIIKGEKKSEKIIEIYD
ncbi:MAG: DUF167 domain-containing protein [Candidatus Pacebacteria bacterium]|nr:DUF167 domain-containing protein [Candidatus Paceibacterota bacterium]